MSLFGISPLLAGAAVLTCTAASLAKKISSEILAKIAFVVTMVVPNIMQQSQNGWTTDQCLVYYVITGALLLWQLWSIAAKPTKAYINDAAKAKSENMVANMTMVNCLILLAVAAGNYVLTVIQ